MDAYTRSYEELMEVLGCDWHVWATVWGYSQMFCSGSVVLRVNGGDTDQFLIASLVVVCCCVCKWGYNPLYGCLRSGAGPGAECLGAELLRGCKALSPAGCLGPGEARGTRRRMGSVRDPGPGRAAACVAPHLHAASQPPTPWGGAGSYNPPVCSPLLCFSFLRCLLLVVLQLVGLVELQFFSFVFFFFFCSCLPSVLLFSTLFCY